MRTPFYVCLIASVTIVTHLRGEAPPTPNPDIVSPAWTTSDGTSCGTTNFVLGCAGSGTAISYVNGWRMGVSKTTGRAKAFPFNQFVACSVKWNGNTAVVQYMSIAGFPNISCKTVALACQRIVSGMAATGVSPRLKASHRTAAANLSNVVFSKSAVTFDTTGFDRTSVVSTPVGGP